MRNVLPSTPRKRRSDYALSLCWLVDEDIIVYEYTIQIMAANTAIMRRVESFNAPSSLTFICILSWRRGRAVTILSVGST